MCRAFGFRGLGGAWTVVGLKFGILGLFESRAVDWGLVAMAETILYVDNFQPCSHKPSNATRLQVQGLGVQGYLEGQGGLVPRLRMGIIRGTTWVIGVMNVFIKSPYTLNLPK